MTLVEFAQYCVGLLRFGETVPEDLVEGGADAAEFTLERIVQLGKTDYEIPEGSPLYDFFIITMEFKGVMFDPTDVLREILVILVREDPVIRKELMEDEG